MRSTFEETVLHKTSVFRKLYVFGLFRNVVLGVFEMFLFEFVRILAWNRDEKCCQDPN